MRFVTVAYAGAERPGVLDGDEVVLLPYDDLVAVIESGAGVPADGERIPFRAADLRAPLRRFRRDVLCTGWNYWDHFEESRGKREGQDMAERPTAPTFFTKSPDTVIGPRDPIAFDPRLSSKWDYEAELVVVFGRAGRSIPAA